MCVLCIIQKISRKIAPMFSYLLFPLLTICVLSQLLPQNFNFPLKSHQIACFVVLLSTLLWYDVLLPHLSIWRARYNIRVQEMQRIQAVELQKMRTLATRKCRNCCTVYREQKPLDGKFMCSYCGHSSKKPMLEMPGSKFCVKDSGFDKKSFNHGLGSTFFILKMFFVKFWNKESDCIDRQCNGVSCDSTRVQENRAEKARRKALEKKQAKIEREVMEEEERRQREEIARLVEEHKKLRNKKCELENSKDNLSSVELKRETKKEMHAKKRDQRSEKDKSSSKSVSDVEELEFTFSRGSEKKQMLDKKEIERQKVMIEKMRLQILEGGKSKQFRKTPKNLSSPSLVTGSSVVGNRNSKSARNQYADTNSTQKAGRRYVANKVQPNTNDPKKSRRQLFSCSSTVISKHDMFESLNGELETVFGNQNSESARNQYANANSTKKTDRHSVANMVQPNTNVPKKSWRQLFTCSSTVIPQQDMFENLNGQLETVSSTEQGSSFFSMPIVGCLSPIGKSIPSPVHNSLKVDTKTFPKPCNVANQLEKIQVVIGTDLPSPFDSPLSRSSVLEERTTIGTPNSKRSHDFESDESSNALGFDAWEMWGTPLARVGAEIEGGYCPLFSSVVQGKPNFYSDCSLLPSKPNQFYPSMSHMAEKSPLLRTVTPENTCYSDFENVGAFGHPSPLNTNFNRNYKWAHDCNQLPMPAIPFNLIDSTGWKDSCPYKTSDVYPFELPPTNHFLREEWTIKKLSNSNMACNLCSTSPDIHSGILTNPGRIYM